MDQADRVRRRVNIMEIVCFGRSAAGRGTTASDAIAPMIAKAYPITGTGANEKILLNNKGGP
jgi:hypothetical protein